MRLDSIRTIKCALAGTATSKFTDVLEAVFGIDEENHPEFEAEEDEPDVVPEEGLTTKEAVEGESLSDPVASTSVGVSAKCKAPTSTTTAKSKRKSSKPVKGGVCALVDATVFNLLIQTHIFTLGFLVSTFLNAKVVSTNTLLCTCVITQKLRISEEIKFLLVTLCVKINLKFLPTFDNSTWVFVWLVTFAVIAGGLPLSGRNI